MYRQCSPTTRTAIADVTTTPATGVTTPTTEAER
jgi:hypothetical protein